MAMESRNEVAVGLVAGFVVFMAFVIVAFKIINTWTRRISATLVILSVAPGGDIMDATGDDIAKAVSGDIAEAVSGDIAKAVNGDIAKAVNGDIAKPVNGDISETTNGDTTGAADGDIMELEFDDYSQEFPVGPPPSPASDFSS